MSRVLIMEDKKETRELLINLVKEISSDAEIIEVADEEKGYVAAMVRTIDVFMIDIILHPDKTGDQSGAVFAQKIRGVERYRFTPIIFITTLYDTKLCMYSTVQCYSFIEKPFDIEKTKRIIADAMHYHTTDIREKSLIYQTDGLIGTVSINDIIYIESVGHVLHIKTVKEEIRIPYKSCKQVMEEMDSDMFVQCSRSTIVNLDKIEKIDTVNRYIHLKEKGGTLEIGRVLKKSFMKRFFERNKKI